MIVCLSLNFPGLIRKRDYSHYQTVHYETIDKSAAFRKQFNTSNANTLLNKSRQNYTAVNFFSV